jgi:hypothetical protein
MEIQYSICGNRSLEWVSRPMVLWGIYTESICHIHVCLVLWSAYALLKDLVFVGFVES